MATARQRVMVGAAATAAGVALVGVALGARPGRGEPLESPLGGSERAFAWRGHRVFYTTRGAGPRLVLAHAIHAAASSFEWRHSFRPLSRDFEVFAPDLIGFGKSDRPALRYSARVYLDLLADFLGGVAPGGAIVAASGLTGAYAVQVACEAPHLVRGLVLVAPAGAGRLAAPAGPSARAVGAALRSPGIGEAAFAALVSRPSLRYYLRRVVCLDPDGVTGEALDYYYRTAHQPGARHAPAAFLGGALNLDAREAFARLPQPVALVRGSRPGAAALEEAEAFRRLRPGVRLEVLEGAAGLAHEERPEAFHEVVRGVAAAVAGPAAGVPRGRV